MLLEQIEKKAKVLQMRVHILKDLIESAREDYRVQTECDDKEIGDHKTMGISVSSGVRHRLDKVARKYSLRKSRRQAALLAINAGCRILLDTEELEASQVEDIQPLSE
ncbi:MAG: hypothetical protein DRQ64_00315 [Gammaproteobacteria bacterium]|nr:MAG: hypothetical protein DRQ64_00315 [Gammaproteobacteria bacterium]